MKGVVSNVRGRDLWVKLVPILGGGMQETRVSPAGYSLFEPLNHGRYLVVVTREVEATVDTNVRIDL